ncbi:hypothetical protein BH11CYA1_BH11CYA1_13890 [soil metagenome]
MKSIKNLIQSTIFLALSCILIPYAALSKSSTDSASIRKPSSSKEDCYVLSFPAGPALAEILWNTAPEDAGKVKGRVLATGKVSVPKNKALEIVLRVESLEHMEALEQLAKLPVRNLIAAKLDFEDSHLQHFKNFKELAYLNLDETLVTDKSIPTISGFSNLVALRLSSTDVTGTNFDALTKLQRLATLNIHGISLKPGCLLKLKGVLVHLRDFDFSAVNLPHEDAAALTYGVILKSIDTRGNKGFDDSCIGYLAKMQSLKSLNVTDTKVTEKSLPALAKLPRLKTIIVRGRTFWTGGVPKETGGRLRVVDSASTSNATLDIFKPLH